MRHESPNGDAGKGSERKHVWDDPRNVRRLIQWFLGSCVFMLLLDAVVHRHESFEHGLFAIEGWFGFFAIYGFVACVLLVLVAKQMRKVLMRPEDYYEARFHDPEAQEKVAEGRTDEGHHA